MRIRSIELSLAVATLAPILGVFSMKVLYTDEEELQLRLGQNQRTLQGGARVETRRSGDHHGEGNHGGHGGGSGQEMPEKRERGNKSSKSHGDNGRGGGMGMSNEMSDTDIYNGHRSGGGGGGGSKGAGHSSGYPSHGDDNGGNYDIADDDYVSTGNGGDDYFYSEGGDITGAYYGSGGGGGGGSSSKPYPYTDDNYYDDYFVWDHPQKSPHDPYSDDNYYDDYFTWGDDAIKSPGYDDYFQYPSLDDYVPGYDDFFVVGDDYYYPPGGGGGNGGGGKGEGKGGKGGKGSKSSKNCKMDKKNTKAGKGSKGGHYFNECEDDDIYPVHDDDIYPVHDDFFIPYDDHIAVDDFPVDDIYFVVPRPVATIWGEAFSPQTTIDPVVPNAQVPDSLDLGTVYLFTNWTRNVQDIDRFEIPVFVDGEEVIIWISLDGYCTRFGNAGDNSAQGYCHFTYTVYDPETLLTSGSFAAEGFLVDATQPGEFTILGGTGILTGAGGIVEISPAVLDESMIPPLVVSPPEGADIFDGLAGYVHYFEVQADLFFFMPDLYYTGKGGNRDGYYHL